MRSLVLRPLILQMSIDIPAPPDEVWRWLVDWENLHLWMLEGSDFKVTSDHTEGVGVTAEATIRIAGIKTRDAIKVTRWEPPTALEIAHLGWVKGSGLLRCTPTGQGHTMLGWTETLVAPMGILGRVGIALFAPLMKRIFVRDLKALRSLVTQG